jgi:glycosyltransferase involved in cell wall biosynthesis
MAEKTVNAASTLQPGISIVICCNNSEQVIASALSGLRRQTLPPGSPAQLIIVDNLCTDSSIQLIREKWDRDDIELKIVTEPQPGVVHARRKGVAAADYSYLLFVDDDNELTTEWLEFILAKFASDEKIGAIGGLNTPSSKSGQALPPWFDTFQGIYACGPQSPSGLDGHLDINRRVLWGAGLAFRTGIIKEIYAENSLLLTGRTGDRLWRGDDSELCYLCALKGFQLHYYQGLRLVHHLLPERVNLNYLRRASFGDGAASVVLRRYSSTHRARFQGQSVSNFPRKWMLKARQLVSLTHKRIHAEVALMRTLGRAYGYLKYGRHLKALKSGLQRGLA